MEFEDLRQYLVSYNNCNICNSNDTSNWGERGALKLVKCNKCGLVYINPRLSDEGLNKFYTEYYKRRKDDIELTESRKIMYGLEADLLLKHIASHRNILDVGCGGGGFLRAFPESFSKIGTEYDTIAAKEAETYGIPCYVGDFLDLNIKETPIDIIIFRGVIEHVVDPKKTLYKASKLLSDDGLLYITSTPNLDSVCAEVYRGYWNMVGPDHLFYFNETILSRILKQTGLSLIDEYHFYEETPYQRLMDDYGNLKVDLNKLRKGETINNISPPFWGNMLSLVYKKNVRVEKT